MTGTELTRLYQDYIDCLNRQDWPQLAQLVDETVHYNGRTIGLAGYREMLRQDYRRIPDLRFTIELLAGRPTPDREPLGLRLHARRQLPGPAGERPAGEVHGERLLRVPRPQDRAGLVAHRQGGHRSAAVARMMLWRLELARLAA